ncbi:MAG TPA: adenylyl-sulfate kinase [Anaeromyxobacteraceae bacterium]|jgi:adenylyl-sulfate kinase|nr:adenylyl-sulfate kinase [Anaeromyxobacteraceae bacterium]
MEAQPQSSGFVIWITGMNGAGKTTLASYLWKRLVAVGRAAELLDGEDPGQVLTSGLGNTKEDRDVAVRRIGYVAKLLARNGAIAVCASLSPHREPREQLKREIRRFVEIFVECDFTTLQERSGRLRKAMAGEIKNVPGYDDPYEPPTHADLVVRSDQERVEAEANRIFQALVDLKYVGPAEFGRLTGGLKPKRAAKAARGGSRKKLAAKAAARKAPKKVAARSAKPARKSKR